MLRWLLRYGQEGHKHLTLTNILLVKKQFQKQGNIAHVNICVFVQVERQSVFKVQCLYFMKATFSHLDNDFVSDFS